MKRSGSRVVIAGLLSLQLIAALSVDRPVEASPRNFGSGSVVSHSSRLPEPRTEQLTANRVTSINGANVSDHLNYALLNSSILLTGRNGNRMLLDDRLPLNLLLSNGHVISNRRAFLVGHLIKNAYTKTYRLLVSGKK